MLPLFCHFERGGYLAFLIPLGIVPRLSRYGHLRSRRVNVFAVRAFSGNPCEPRFQQVALKLSYLSWHGRIIYPMGTQCKTYFHSVITFLQNALCAYQSSLALMGGATHKQISTLSTSSTHSSTPTPYAADCRQSADKLSADLTKTPRLQRRESGPGENVRHSGGGCARRVASREYAGKSMSQSTAGRRQGRSAGGRGLT